MHVYVYIYIYIYILSTLIGVGYPSKYTADTHAHATGRPVFLPEAAEARGVAVHSHLSQNAQDYSCAHLLYSKIAHTS